MYVSCIYIYAKRIFSRGDTLKKHQKVRFAYIYMREMNFLMIFWEDTLFQFGLTLHPFSIWCLASPDVRSGKIIYKSVLKNPFLDLSIYDRRTRPCRMDRSQLSLEGRDEAPQPPPAFHNDFPQWMRWVRCNAPHRQNPAAVAYARLENPGRRTGYGPALSGSAEGVRFGWGRCIC